jgi:hypothetical protein
MRTTINLAPDLLARLRSLAREREATLSEVVNDTLREGLDPGRGGARRYRVPTRPLGLRPGIDLTRATALAAAMEDDELARKLELRK